MRRRWSGWQTAGLLILAFFVLFVIFPLVLILYKSVVDGNGAFTLEYFQKFFAKKYYWITIWNSLKVTVCSTLISILIGMPLAYVMKSFHIRGEKLLNLLIIISYVSPPFIGAYAWIQLLGRNGLVTRLLNSLLAKELGGIYGFAGIVPL